MFEGFETFDLATSATTIHGRCGGSGPALLLLHGIPETHLMWHRVAPTLAERFTVVATDLRGYGDSGKPTSTDDHAPYAMRELAMDQVEVMRVLGYERFHVVGHDRGARCAYRMALDHPDAVDRLAVLDIVPTLDAFERTDLEFVRGFWVWYFLAAPEPVPERLITAQPQVIVDHMLDTWADKPDAIPPEVRAEYVAKFADEETVHAICEEYRAAATLDLEHDRADRGTKKIRAKTLALWSKTGGVSTWPDPLQVWRNWCDDVTGEALDCGHFLPEEAPDETARKLVEFLA